MTKEGKMMYIRAFFDGEGSIVNNRISFGNTNLKLLRLVQEFLQDFGISAKISKQKPRKDKKRKPMWNLKFWGYEKIRKFKRRIGTYHEEKNKKIMNYLLKGDVRRKWRN